MNTAKELLEKAKTAKTAAELLEMAKAENIEMTAEDAEKAFADLHKAGEVSDEELDNVSGGGCSKPSNPYKVGTTVLTVSDGKWVEATILSTMIRGKSCWLNVKINETGKVYCVPAFSIKKKE